MIPTQIVFTCAMRRSHNRHTQLRAQRSVRLALEHHYCLSATTVDEINTLFCSLS